MHVLQIVVRNTSTLDTTLPLLWKLVKDPHTRVSVLYCVADKRQILRDGEYFDRKMREWDVKQYDFGDFLRGDFPWLERAWRSAFSVTSLDGLPVRSLLHRPSLKALGAFLIGQPRLRRLLEQRLGNLLVDSGRIMEALDPDVVLFDHRARVEFYGREHFFDYFERERRPVVLLPHSPHDIRPTSAFAPFDEQGEEFPEYCTYWSPFRFSETQKLAPDREHGFVYVGYPGLDSDWNRYLEHEPSHEARDGPLRCLVTTRRFYARGVAVPDKEKFVASYADVEAALQNAVEALKGTGREVELVIKPHPSGSRPHLRELVEDLEIDGCQISYEPWYALLPSLDLVISGFTTSLMLPLAFGVPTIIVNSDVQEYVHEWDVLERLYTGCAHFLDDPEELRTAVSAVVGGMIGSSAVPSTALDRAHIREFFPDGALSRGIELIERLGRRHDAAIP